MPQVCCIAGLKPPGSFQAGVGFFRVPAPFASAGPSSCCLALALHRMVAFAEPLEVVHVVGAAFFVGYPVVEFEGAGAFTAVCVLAFVGECCACEVANAFPFAR